ncbi:MAG: DUF4198 domain-containing protein [Candidatus Kryptonium sp.]
MTSLRNLTGGGVMIVKRLMLTLIFSLVFYLGILHAHDLWLEERDGKICLFHGHEGQVEPYDVNRVVAWKALSVDGKDIKVNKITEKDGVCFMRDQSKLSLLNVTFDNKYWVKTQEGWKNIGKREAQKQGFQILESGRSLKFAKYLKQWSKTMSNPIGTEIEIVALNNPFSNNKLRIKVLLQGKPFANAPIYLSGAHEESAKTDEKGEIALGLKKGLNLISTKTRVPLTGDEDADSKYLRASLSFIRK